MKHFFVPFFGTIFAAIFAVVAITVLLMAVGGAIWLMCFHPLIGLGILILGAATHAGIENYQHFNS